jgi:uncharacterized repeat protein (TIGR02543 family)
MSGYITDTIPSFDVSGDVTDKALELVKYVEPVYEIRGTITTDNPGGGAGGASVQLKQSGSNVGNAVNTAVDGTYTIHDVPAGTYTIDVTMTGYTPGAILSFTVADHVTGKNLTLVRIVYTVSGTITTDNPSGGLANGASVQLKQGGGTVGGPVTTGSDGAYTITDVPAGDYTIEVSLAGYTTGTISSVTVAGDVTGKNLTLVRIVYTISGTITTDNPGGAANGASVQLKQGGSDVGSVVTTAANGTYTISNVLPGNDYTIEVSMTGYTTGTSSSFNVTTGDVTGKNLILARIICTVTFDEDGGTPVQAASVGEGDKAAKPAAPVKTNYIFAGWYKEPGLTNLWDFAADTVTEAMTLYARWIPFKMVLVPANNTAFPTGLGDSETGTVSFAYEIGETEVTYELWYTVRTWAEANGYSFHYSNPGQEGGGGSGGASPTTANQQPVTAVSWFSAVVWLNALTEWVNENTGSNLTPVYYYDKDYEYVAKNSNPALNFEREVGSHDHASAYAKVGGAEGFTGFRLPHSLEWELAARWRGGDATNAVINPPFNTAPYFTKGDSASGATGNYNTPATEEVAWYNGNAGSTTHPVKELAPNWLGLYDMSGNVYEWCSDWNAVEPGKQRNTRGGSSFVSNYNMQVGLNANRPPDEPDATVGFRLVRAAP